MLLSKAVEGYILDGLAGDFSPHRYSTIPNPALFGFNTHYTHMRNTCGSPPH